MANLNWRTLGVATLLAVSVCGNRAARADVFVTEGNDTTDSVLLRYTDAGTLVNMYGLGTLNHPRGVTVGPDGFVYVCDTNNAQVLKFDPVANTFSTFISPGSGGLFAPITLKWRNNQAYVTDFGSGGTTGMGSGGVLRYNSTGSFDKEFVPPGTGPADGCLNAAYGEDWGADGNLYVSNINAFIVDPAGTQPNSVNIYDGSSGAFVNYLTVDASGNVDGVNTVIPRGIEFGPNSNLYIGEGDTTNTDANYASVTEWFIPRATPDFDKQFVTSGSGGLQEPRGIDFTPLGLMVVDRTGGQVLLYDSNTGAFITAFATGLNLPTHSAYYLVQSMGTIKSLKFKPKSTKVGKTAKGTVTLTQAAGINGVSVSLSYLNGDVTGPSSVTVAAGSKTGTFTVTGAAKGKDVVTATSSNSKTGKITVK